MPIHTDPENQEAETPKKEQRSATILGVILIVIGVAILADYLVIPPIKNQHDQQKIYELAVVPVPVHNDDTKIQEVESEDAFSVDFKALFNVNPDTIAWVLVDGTDISFPVVREKADDENYYLKHNYFGDPSTHGTIFLDQGCSDDFSDFLSVLYGHDMRDGSMFAGLHQFEDEAFFNEHKTVHIYTPDDKKTYTIASVSITGTENRMSAYGYFQEAGSKDAFLRDMQVSSLHLRRDIPLTNSSRYITLSTCTDDGRDRFHVTAVEAM